MVLIAQMPLELAIVIKQLLFLLEDIKTIGITFICQQNYQFCLMEIEIFKPI